ncbi:MAG: TolC family protein [Elusimicrobiota bacterium]|nr:TolC family protein [Elusimicrobiota bacterium]
MKIFLIPLLFALLPCGLPAQEFSTGGMRPITLGEACALSLAKSEQLAQQGEGIKQLEAAERLLNAAFRPSFDLNASQYKQQNSASVTRGYLSGSYSLFSGMRDYISQKAAAARTGAAQLDLARAGQQLYLGVAQAYLNLLAAQREVLIRGEQLDVTGKRIAELEARVDIGRSRKSEAVAVKTQLAQDKASYLNAAAAERLAQQALMFLTGLDADLAPGGISLSGEAALESYLKTALQRPDLAARRKSLEVTGYLLDVQDRNLWPTVTVSANYYVVRHPLPDPVNRWDGNLAVNIPLYKGGAAQAQRQAAYSVKRAAVTALQLAERQALTEVRSAYEELKYSALQAASLEEALALASGNALYQEEDYKLGLVTNLDVLSALNTVQQTRLALSQARVQEIWTLLKLKTAAGQEIR